MYRTCLFCNADLGANEVIESFPVGRRLAFDAARGRLWVVCRKCERWNLTPLEERWEAIEQCERAFSGTRLRVSTDNVGLARLREGLELVRIGAPQRPELAAWRYGDQFGRRRRRNMLLTGAAIVGVGAIAAGGWAAGIGFGVLGQSGNLFNVINSAYRVRRRVRIPLADGGAIETNLLLASKARLVAAGGEPRLALKLAPPRGRMAWGGIASGTPVELHGVDAVRAAGALLPLINRAGGAERDVRDAVGVLEAATSAESLYARIAQDEKARFERRTWQFGEVGLLAKLPKAERLALEMAAHEEQERRALEGELAELERAWKDAEEIARIADDMFVDDDVTARLERIRREREAP